MSKESNKRDKLIELNERIMKYADKIGEKLELQQCKVEVKVKKEKK